MEPLSLNLKSSMKGRAKEIASTSHRAFEQIAWKIHKRLSIKQIRSASNFWRWKLEVERIFTSVNP
jgi:hypothetical protein